MTWLPATDPLPHTAKHIEKPCLEEPISSRFWPFLTKIGWKRSKTTRNRPEIHSHQGLGRGVSRVGRGGLCCWVVKSQSLTLPNYSSKASGRALRMRQCYFISAFSSQILAVKHQMSLYYLKTRGPMKGTLVKHRLSSSLGFNTLHSGQKILHT